MKQFFIYILSNKKNGTLYTGVTSNLGQKIFQHKEKLFEGFTSKYSVDQLIWHEQHESAESAIIREKQIKKWKREWKIKIIEKMNLNGKISQWMY